MNELTSRIKGKLAGSQGETIVEALVSVLIGGLALLFLAMAIAVSVHITADSRDSMDDYYRNSSNLAGNTSGATSGTVTVKEGAVAVPLDESGNDVSVTVYQLSEDDNGKPAASYRKAD